MGGIARLVASMSCSEGRPKDSRAQYTEVQHIQFPPHHQDNSAKAAANQQKCKGFALVTLSSTECADELVRQWPWEGSNMPKGSGDDLLKQAEDSGVRVLSKARWDTLQEEYVAYRDKLLTVMTSAPEQPTTDPNVQNSSTLPPSTTQISKGRHRVSEHSPSARDTEEPTAVPQIAASPNATLSSTSPFPPNCLVFVRNIHPETNKMTLKTIFGAALNSVSSADGSAPQSDQLADGIDYVDFTKGLDSVCFLIVFLR